jgi:hypothetical protein
VVYLFFPDRLNIIKNNNNNSMANNNNNNNNNSNNVDNMNNNDRNNNNNNTTTNNNNYISNNNNNNNNDETPDQNANENAAADVSTQTIYECQDCNAQKLLKLKREMITSETQTDAANLHNETLCCLSNIRIPFADTSLENSEMDQHYQKESSGESSLEPEEALTPMTEFQPNMLPSDDQTDEVEDDKKFVETNL